MLHRAQILSLIYEEGSLKFVVVVHMAHGGRDLIGIVEVIPNVANGGKQSLGEIISTISFSVVLLNLC